MYSYKETLPLEQTDRRKAKHITFAKFPGEPYRYIGTFIRDMEASKPSDHLFRRISTSENLSYSRNNNSD